MKKRIVKSLAVFAAITVCTMMFVLLWKHVFYTALLGGGIYATVKVVGLIK